MTARSGAAKYAKAYGVTSLPTTFLVDGTTGKLLATPAELKAESIGTVLERVIAIREALGPR